MPLPVEQYGSLTAIAAAREAVFATPTSPMPSGVGAWIPMDSVQFNPDTGVFFPKLMLGQRDVNIYNLYGQAKYVGKITYPLYPGNGIVWLAGAIGYDGGRGTTQGGTALVQGSGVTGTAPTTAKTGTLGVLSSGATGATYTLVSGSAPLVGDIFQIDTNTGTTKTSEVRKLSAVSGAGPYTLTFDQPINYSHIAATPASLVIAPFTHTINQANHLDSFTVEKLLGETGQGEQYVGTRVNKYNIKATTTNKEVQSTVDTESAGMNILTAVDAINVDFAYPFVFQETTVTFFGSSMLTANDIEVDMDNGIKPQYTFNQTYGPSYTPTLTRHITGKLDVVFTSATDATYGFLQKYLNRGSVTGTVAVNFTHPDGTSVEIDLQKVAFSKYTDSWKAEDVATVSLSYEAMLDTAALKTVTAIIKNNNYLPI